MTWGALNEFTPQVLRPTKMAPDASRFAARLAELSQEDLLDLAARGCHDVPAFRRYADWTLQDSPLYHDAPHACSAERIAV